MFFFPYVYAADGPDNHRSGLKQIRLLIEFPRVECWPSAVNSFHKYSDGLQIQVGMHDTSATVSADVRLQYRSAPNKQRLVSRTAVLIPCRWVCLCMLQASQHCGLCQWWKGKSCLEVGDEYTKLRYALLSGAKYCGEDVATQEFTGNIKSKEASTSRGKRAAATRTPVWHNRFLD